MNKINANSFPWIPTSVVFYSMERFYINMNWINRETGLWFDPIYQAVDLDPKLKERRDLNKKVLLTINQTAEWRLRRDGVPNLNDGHWTETKLGKWQKDGTNPLNWTEEGEDYFKITARYGRKAWPIDRLGVDTTNRWGVHNIPLTAQNLVTHIEPGNEDVAWWRPAITSLTAPEFAARMSLIYDGHEGRVPFAGIKTADPTMLVVLPGLPNLDLNYLKQMNEWFKANRTDKKFACDVMNVHHYSNAGNTFENLTSQWTQGCSPEQDQVRIKLKAVVDFANSLSLPTWWSEFGYNTRNVNTTQGIVPFGNKSTEQIQSEWLKRSYIEGLLAGVDNMFMFETADEHRRDEGGMWITCGMVLSQYDKEGKVDIDSYKPKLSWFGLKNLNLWLSGATELKESNIDGVRIISFKSGNTKRHIYYMPTSNDSTKSLTINNTTLTATEDPQLFEGELVIIDPVTPPTPPVKPDKETFEIILISSKGRRGRTVIELI